MVGLSYSYMLGAAARGETPNGVKSASLPVPFTREMPVNNPMAKH